MNKSLLLGLTLAFSSPIVFAEIISTFTPTEQAAYDKAWNDKEAMNAQAAKDNERYRAELEKLDKQIASLQTQTDLANQKLTEANQAVDREVKENPERNTSPRVGSFGTSESWEMRNKRQKAKDDYAADKKRIDAELARLKADRDSGQKKYDQGQKEIDSNLKNYSKVKQKIKEDSNQKNTDVYFYIDNLRTDDKFMLDQIHSDRLGIALERLQDRIDQMAIGVYVKEKFNRVLASPAMCKAVDGCQKGTKNNGMGSAELDPLFRTSPTNSSSSTSGVSGTQQTK